MEPKPIQEQVIAVVGASSGIGRETALQFARRGAKLVVAARSQSGLQTLVEEIQQLGASVIAVVADVADFQQVKAIADKAVEYYGRLDTWVHLAATSVFATFDNLTPEEFKRVIDVNLVGQAYGAMAALPHMKQQGYGALIHVSSVEGRRSLPYQSAYSSSKHGIQGFLDALRLELIHQKLPISVTSIMPAVINTPFYNKSQTKLGVKPTGVPPYYDPGLVAEAILHAAEHPSRDVIVGDVGRIVDFLQRLSPQLMDSILLLIGFDGQLTQDKKSADSPHNVYEPIPEYDRVEGDFDRWVIPSLSDWVERNPIGRLAGVALGIAGVAWIAAQLFRGDSA